MNAGMHQHSLETAWQNAGNDAQARADFLRQLSGSTVVVILRQPPGPGAAAPERNLMEWMQKGDEAKIVPVFTNVAHLKIPIPSPARAVSVPMRLLLAIGGDERRYLVNPLSARPVELGPLALAQMRSFFEAQSQEVGAPSRDAPWAFEFPDEALYPVAVALAIRLQSIESVYSAYIYELRRGEAPPIVVLGLDASWDPELTETLTDVAVDAGVNPSRLVVRYLPDEPSHRAGLTALGLPPFYQRP
jgi:hypothetical protein